MLLWYKELNLQIEPKSAKAIRQQALWHNNAVSVQGRALVSTPKIEAAISQIEDIVDGSGRILTYTQFSERYPNITVNPLSYMGYCRTIPKHWKDALVGSVMLTAEERSEKVTVTIKGKMVALELLKCGYFYTIQIRKSEVTPTAQTRWIQDGYDLDNWQQVYRRAFRTTSSTKLQSLQFRIVHRYFPVNTFLYGRHITFDPFCDNCGLVDTLKHYFYDCAEVQRLWAEITLKLNARGIYVIFFFKTMYFLDHIGCPML